MKEKGQIPLILKVLKSGSALILLGGDGWGRSAIPMVAPWIEYIRNGRCRAEWILRHPFRPGEPSLLYSVAYAGRMKVLLRVCEWCAENLGVCGGLTVSWSPPNAGFLTETGPSCLFL